MQGDPEAVSAHRLFAELLIKERHFQFPLLENTTLDFLGSFLVEVRVIGFPEKLPRGRRLLLRERHLGEILFRQDVKRTRLVGEALRSCLSASEDFSSSCSARGENGYNNREEGQE